MTRTRATRVIGLSLAGRGRHASLDDRTSREPYASAERCEEQRRHHAAQVGVLWKQVRCVGPGPTHSTTQEITPATAKVKALVGTWSGTIYAQRSTYPLTITFR